MTPISRLPARLLHPRWVAPLVLVLVGAVELALTNRKYGIFSGGFGQSQTVDTGTEIALFLLGYALSQLAAAALAYALVARLSRSAPAWRVSLHFAFVYAGLSLLVLTVQLQLHSYFSDAMSFALLRQLGGGSLTDALLFGRNEIALGLAGVAFAVLCWWLIARLLGRWLDEPDAPPAPRLRWRWPLLAAAVFAGALAAIPPAAADAARGLDRTAAWSGAARLAALASDFDGDGYGLVGLRRDTHPFDPARHPLALDIPGNGIDEDGFGGDLRLVPVHRPRPQANLPAGGPHLVIVVFESTRADVLGKRIDGRPVAPNLEAIAALGGAASPVYSPTAFTTASLKSLFAGALAPRAGDPSLFTELAAAGYRIGVISGQPEDFGDISATVGMRDNADVFVDAEALKDQRAFSFAAQGSLLVDEGVLMSEFDRHYGAADHWRRPNFLYLNFQSPHFPYDHPGVPHVFADPPLPRAAITAANAAGVQRTYWNAVAHADAHLGALVARLKRLGVWDESILLVTGDHGEALFEDGFLGHGHIIEDSQFATFLVANRPLGEARGPLALADARAVVIDLLRGDRPSSSGSPPFMHIGSLNAPSAIGLALPDAGLVSLRLDTGLTCFARTGECTPYAMLTGSDRALADLVVARWGSERWAARSR